MEKLKEILKSIYNFIFHFNPAEDIEWDCRSDEEIKDYRIKK